MFRKVHTSEKEQFSNLKSMDTVDWISILMSDDEYSNF